MHLLIVMAFGLLIWRTGRQPFPLLVEHTSPSLAVVVIQPLLWWIVARACSIYALRRLRTKSNGAEVAPIIYHRTSLLLRIFIFAGFAADLFLTRWPLIIESIDWFPPWSGIGDLVTISPFLVALVVVWHAQFPIDHALRALLVNRHRLEGVPHARVWTLREYLSFNIRYQILTVLVPIAIILLTYRLCEHHRAYLVDAFLFPWIPDALLALVAALIFILSPVLLKTIWATSPLEDGPLRRRLEQACRRTGLRCRNILVWDSYGMMINAAVMGMFAPARYVLLSDGLLEGLSEDEIEAVFGHEAGHVRLHHIPYFLLFAVASVLLVSGVMELIVRLSEGPEPRFALSETAIQGIGLGLIAVVWGVAFGWLSRRFERQADVFGARCVSVADSGCDEACSVHQADDGPPARGHPVCVGGAKVFVAALDQVAALNGIPHEERSWRHSSIASRMRFLMAQAGDPTTAEAFHRLIRNIKRMLWIAVVGGLIATLAYCLWQPFYREVIIQNTIQPLHKLAEKGG